MRLPCALSPSRVCTLSRVLACLALCACNLDNLGDPPPEAEIILPTGLALSPQPEANSKPRYLYVINSNFDLRYNRGSLQAYDLDVLNARVDACAQEQGEVCQIPSNWVDPDSSRPVLADEVLVPSLTTSFSISPDAKRFYLATRTDPGLTYIDLDEAAEDPENVLQCMETDRRCDDLRQVGKDPNQRGQQMPPEPVDMVSLRASEAEPGLDADSVPGNFIAVAHRHGQLSLFHDPGKAAPRLVDVIENLPAAPTGVTFDASSHLLYMSLYNSSLAGLPRSLARVGIAVETSAQPRDGSTLEPSFVYDASPVVIQGVASQRDTRAIATNPARPGELLVTSRDPAALLFVDPQTVAMPNDSAALTSVSARDVVNVGAGPLRMALGRVGERDIVAVTCFDGHQLYLVDAVTAEVLTVIHNLNGPFELAIDSGRQRLYLADFRASTIQIVELKGVAAEGTGARTDAPVIARLGIPKVVQELQ